MMCQFCFVNCKFRLYYAVFALFVSPFVCIRDLLIMCYINLHFTYLLSFCLASDYECTLIGLLMQPIVPWID